MPRHSDPINDLFNELLDATIDAVIDTMTPEFRRLAREAVTNAKTKADAKATKTNKRTTNTRTNTTRRERPTVTPPQLTMYDVLEVSPRASQETINAAFRSLARQYHPDSKPGHEHKFKEITHAHELLKDPVKRKQYDRSIGL